IGGLTVGDQLGKGPLAATWLLHGASGAPEAVLRVLLLRRPDFQERFTSSAKLLIRRAHVNLVALRELVTIDGHVGVITEHVGGGNLARWLTDQPRTTDQVVPMFYEIARGAGAAHHAGLLHRNLKPTKVLLTAHGRPKIAGFILGKIMNPTGPGVTDLSETFGTPQFMAPEQFRGARDVDHRADLFSLGCILYQMLTGRRPFDDPDRVMVYKHMMTGEMAPLPATTPAALVGIVADLLDPDPALRPPSADALLERFLEDTELRRLLPADLAQLGTDPDIVYDPNATVPPHPGRNDAPTPRSASTSDSFTVARRRSGAPSLPPPPSKRGSPTGDVSLRRDGVGGTPRPPTPRSDGPPSVPPGGFAADVPDPSDAVTSFYDRISYAIEENWSWVLLGLSSLAIAIVSVLFAIAYLSMSVG
ncbi:MAG: protein kinase, partial [Myxococcota bacterium]